MQKQRKRKETTVTQTQTQTSLPGGISLPLDLHLSVDLSGPDGNAFAILSKVLQGMRERGLPQELQRKFYEEALSKDYHHLLGVVGRWVHLERI